MFNRDRLFVPAAAAKVRQFSLATPAAPAPLADLDPALDLEVVSVAVFSNGDLVLADQKNGRLVRLTRLGVVVWNVESRATTEIPVQVAVDALDQVWVAMRGGKLARFNSSGSLLNRVDDTEAHAVQCSAATFAAGYNGDTGEVVLVDVGSGTLVQSFNLADVSTEHEGSPVVQLGMLDENLFVCARRKDSLAQDPGTYEVLKLGVGTLIEVLPLRWERALVGAMCSVAGDVWAMDEFSVLAHFRSDSTLEGLYGLESLGRLSAMAFSEAASVVYALSDDLFGSARLHTLDPLSSVAQDTDYAGAAMSGGDLTGYQRGTVTATVAETAPVIDASKIDAQTFAAASVISGKPGAALGATSVSCTLGSASIEADGSFVISGSPAAPGTIALTFTGPGGTTPQNVSLANHAETVTIASFLGTRFGLAGGHVQIALKDGSGPLTTGTHYLRIKDLSTGKYWNGSAFVTTNGYWLQFTHRDGGLWSYLFQPQKAGDYAVLFSENSVVAYDGLQVSSEPEDTAETLSQVNQMAAPGAALLAPTALFQDEAQIGGFLAGRLDRLQFLLNILAFRAQVVFPKVVEGIAAFLTATLLKQGDTPLLLFTVTDGATLEPKDLTDHVVRLRCRTQPGGQLIFDRELDLVDAANGQCQVRLAADDTDVAGSFVAELVDTAPDGVVLTTTTFNLTIQRNLG